MAVLTSEQTMLRDAARNWAQHKNPVVALRRLRDSGSELGYDPGVWKDISDMGWAGVVVPEEFGGSGFGYLSIGLILEETGRTLTASPLIASAVAAATALTLGGGASQKAIWLPRIADGSAVATLACDEGVRHAPDVVALTATRSGNDYVLSGNKVFVIEGMAADLLIVSARLSDGLAGNDGIALFLVPANAAGVMRDRLSIFDSRGAANIGFHDVRVGSDALLKGGHALLEITLDCARAAVTAEMLGAANQAFDITLGYLKTRVQFGQVIGSFQALQHRAARIFMELELARSAVEAALIAIDACSPEVPSLVSAAKVKMGDTFHLMSIEMIQMHGGIGMTDAHDAGFYMKRARVAAASYGHQAYHRDRYARLNGF
jgi:alkylation response protein AidB-like acyl-CoA dehydrogenase